MKISFNKPYMTGRETEYIREAVASGKISGNGLFTQKCQHFFERRYGFKKCLLTTSCTDALEMAAILSDIGPGDEVIVPSFTFVSTALAFVRQGATIVFADSTMHHPNMDVDAIEELITPRTKIIVPVHYAGIACDMDRIMAIAERHNLLVVEDAAQAVDASYYSERHGRWMPLGGIGHLGCFSFHETKNIISGEGGMLAINDERFMRRAEIIWEKGTNRAEFFRGEVNKYGWVDIGSSFLPSEIVAAFLFAQLEQLDMIQRRRREIWQIYFQGFGSVAQQMNCELPLLPSYATNNAHMFYLVFPSLTKRTDFIDHLKTNGIQAVFHYLSLHSSEFYRGKHDGRVLPNCDRFADCLVRLPMFYELSDDNVRSIIQSGYQDVDY
jgi:dTDP-4-amino-4,6-dideoxygalactose transaminase